jgi:hypothetical protein
MTIKASGRSALILAAWLGLCLAGPMRITQSHAQDADGTKAEEAVAPSKPIALTKFTKPHHARVAAKAQRSAKVAAKATAAKDVAEPAKDADAAPASTDAFANAHAQLPADAPAETPQTVAAKADNVFKGMGGTPDAGAAYQPAASADAQPAATADVVAPDQLNELDRAASDTKPALTLASATLDAPVVVSNDDSSTLDKTSLIGKIFIACGGLLTLASAARMFIA